MARLSKIAVFGVLLAGCTTLRPVRGVTPEVGSKVAFDVNDAGRVALGSTIGPEIWQVEGQLVDKDSSGYLVAISSVRMLRGGEQVWTGEQIRLRPEYLGPAYERRFSLGRSLALGVIGIGGFGAILISKSLLGAGATDDSIPCDTCGVARLGRP